MNELVFKALNGVDIKYKYKPSKYDFKHIIFVFSGFLNAKPGNYDFLNALQDCPAHVFWLNDDFDGMYTYYLCQDMDFNIVDAVEEFINYQTKQFKCNKTNLTVTGYSKGGSSALYYGLKLNIKNIVVSVPQIKIGTYITENWQTPAKHMMGKTYIQAQVDYLDKLIPKYLKQETDFDKNIYLLTSEADVQYKTHIEPVLDDLKNYLNFNLLKTYSVFVREHNQITSHHTSLLLSIYYALASEATPRFNNGEVNFYGSQPIPKNDKGKPEPVVNIHKLSVKDKILFIDGVGYLKGEHTQDWADIDYSLIFENSETKEQITKSIAKKHNAHLTRSLFNGDFVVHDKAWFTTPQHKGISISDIPVGEYKLYLTITTKNKSGTAILTSGKEIKQEETGFVLCANRNHTIINLK